MRHNRSEKRRGRERARTRSEGTWTMYQAAQAYACQAAWADLRGILVEGKVQLASQWTLARNE